MSYKILSDSSSNLFTLEGESPYAYVPLKITCEDTDFIDTPRLNIAEMIRMLKSTNQRSTTSCPNVQDWMDAFAGAEEVYAVTITSSLSGSYSAAVQARNLYLQEHPETKIHIVDTLSAGPEMELIIENLAALKQAGLSFEDTVQAITKYCRKSHLLFSLESLKNLANNGRVSHAKAKLVGVLGIRIVGKASDKGTLQPLHKCRGTAKTMETLFSEMLTSGYNGGKVRIAHCCNKEAAENLLQRIKNMFSHADIKIRECTALCSFYAEEGGLLVGFEG